MFDEHTPLKGHGWTHRRHKRVFWALSLLVVVFIISVYQILSPKSAGAGDLALGKVEGKKNVIFFVSDGMGPASLSMARSFQQYTNELPFSHMLNIDSFFIGSSRTRSSNSLVTDSAAGATAFSCNIKTYNGAIGVNAEQQPCGTLMEAAKIAGYLTGLVVTTRVTDATPASFSAHADFRSMEELIAKQQLGEYELGRMVDLIIGGGRTYFYPKDRKSPFGDRGSRTDSRDLIAEAIENGWSYVGDRKSFDDLELGNNVSLPLLGLLADYDIPFELDREDSEHPSLKEQTLTALNALKKATEDSDKGFFLLVEGSRIDHAGHANDAAAQVREVAAYDEAFKAAVDFADNSDVETIIISTSDHETGGLSTARQISDNYPDYLWLPEVLQNATHSGEFLAKKLILESRKALEEKHLREFIVNEILEKDMGILNYDEDDVTELLRLVSAPSQLLNKLNDMVSFRAQIGWATHGHSAVDVNIYAYANKPWAKNYLYYTLLGNHENIEVGEAMREYLNLDLKGITELIKDTKHTQGEVTILSTSVFEYSPSFIDEIRQI